MRFDFCVPAAFFSFRVRAAQSLSRKDLLGTDSCVVVAWQCLDGQHRSSR